MKKIWKWILGIVVALLMIGLVAGAFFLWRNHAFTFMPRPFAFRNGPYYHPNMPNNPSAPAQPNNGTAPTNPGQPNNSNGPSMPRGFGYGRGPMMGHGFEYGPMMGRGGFGYGPMIMQRGFSPFFMGISFFFGLVKLAVFGLLLYAAYWLGRKSAMNTTASVVVSDPAPQRGRKVAKS